MAIIYESDQDVDRERLTQEAKEAHKSQTIGLAALGIGLPLLLWGLTAKHAEKTKISNLGFWETVWERFKTGPSNTLLGAMATFLGIVETWSASRKAKGAEKELEKLGPGKIVSPKLFQMTDHDSFVAEGHHVKRLENSATTNIKSL